MEGTRKYPKPFFQVWRLCLRWFPEKSLHRRDGAVREFTLGRSLYVRWRKWEIMRLNEVAANRDFAERVAKAADWEHYRG